MYYTSNDCNYFGVDVDDYIFNDYEFFDEDYGDYDYCDYDDDDDDFYNKLYYKKPLNYFERLVKNNIVNATSKNDEKGFKLKQKVRDHCHYTGKFRGAAYSICNLRYKTPREIPVLFHNGSTYDYHFIIKQLAEEFKSEFKCLGENTEKYITFPVPIKKN